METPNKSQPGKPQMNRQDALSLILTAAAGWVMDNPNSASLENVKEAIKVITHYRLNGQQLLKQEAGPVMWIEQCVPFTEEDWKILERHAEIHRVPFSREAAEERKRQAIRQLEIIHSDNMEWRKGLKDKDGNG